MTLLPIYCLYAEAGPGMCDEYEDCCTWKAWRIRYCSRNIKPIFYDIKPI